MEKGLYAQFAGLLEYPHEDIRVKLDQCIKTLAEHPEYPPEALEELKTFQKELEEITIDDLQGIFSYTFELSSDYTLDLGYHLFDGFKRANNLASIKAMYRENDFPYDDVAKGELPDHLPVILRFLDFLKDEALKKDFREAFVIKAIERLNINFEKNKKNIYCHLIAAAYRVIDKDVKKEDN